MLSFKSLLAAAVVASSALVSASNQVALYWGQNGAGGQERLAQYCQETDVDIVLLSFLNLFPDPLNVNFANQCGNTFESGLLHCSQIGADIKTCQSLGKTVLLSLGGGVGDYGFSDAASATKFADTLWNKFGAGEDPERPFDDAVIDGFDFDIEHGSTTGYPELATALRSKFAKDSSKTISYLLLHNVHTLMHLLVIYYPKSHLILHSSNSTTTIVQSMANSTMIPGPNLLTLLQTKTSNYLLVFLLLVILLVTLTPVNYPQLLKKSNVTHTLLVSPFGMLLVLG